MRLFFNLRGRLDAHQCKNIFGCYFKSICVKPHTCNIVQELGGQVGEGMANL